MTKSIKVQDGVYVLKTLHHDAIRVVDSKRMAEIAKMFVNMANDKECSTKEPETRTKLAPIAISKAEFRP